MSSFGIYLLKACISITVFYMFYEICLKKLTFFKINRIYLIFGLIASFIVPLLDLSFIGFEPNTTLSSIVHPVIFEPDFDFFQGSHKLVHQRSFDFFLVLNVVYFIAISFMLFRLVFSVLKIVKIEAVDIVQHGRNKIVRSDFNIPFSFFNRVFIPSDETNTMVIEHELAHVNQYHWVDLLLIEIVSVLLWFNPVIFLYKRSLKLQLEYLADRAVTQNTSLVRPYLESMLRNIQAVSLSGLTSQFYCKTIKKRVIMITKNKTSFKYVSLYFLVLPLIGLMLLAFKSNPPAILDNTKIKLVVEETVPSIYPVDKEKVTTTMNFGIRVHPITKKEAFHTGIDLALLLGEKVLSTADGVVVEADFQKNWGNFVIVKHNNTYTTFYSHMQSLSVKAGDAVKQGQEIGLVGSTGLSTGPHVHYEVRKNGTAVDPLDYLPK